MDWATQLTFSNIFYSFNISEFSCCSCVLVQRSFYSGCPPSRPLTDLQNRIFIIKHLFFESEKRMAIGRLQCFIVRSHWTDEGYFGLGLLLGCVLWL